MTNLGAAQCPRPKAQVPSPRAECYDNPVAPSDGWLLAALYQLKEPAATPQIKGVALAMGRSLTEEMIDESIVRLQEAGLAEFLGCEKYMITEEGRRFAANMAGKS